MPRNKIAMIAVLVSAFCCSTSQAEVMFDSFVTTDGDATTSASLIGYAFTVAGIPAVTQLEVTGLGAFDLDFLGIAPGTGLTVSLSEVSGPSGATITPLASVTITTADAFHPFTPGDYDGGLEPTFGFRIEDLASSVMLLAGNTYVVFADYSTIDGEAAGQPQEDNELFLDSTSFVSNPAVDFLSYDDLNTIFPGGVFNDPGTDTSTFGLTASDPMFSSIPFGGTGSNPIGPTIVFGPGGGGPTVPEPSSIALLGMAGIALLARSRRRRKAA